ncbi:hypothetical protein G7046_g4425 [Stylonectria norvegica]|nr:hypothetical protein G7046_g4425 [Stylonectria norvegica]
MYVLCVPVSLPHPVCSPSSARLQPVFSPPAAWPAAVHCCFAAADATTEHGSLRRSITGLVGSSFAYRPPPSHPLPTTIGFPRNDTPTLGWPCPLSIENEASPFPVPSCPFPLSIKVARGKVLTLIANAASTSVSRLSCMSSTDNLGPGPSGVWSRLVRSPVGPFHGLAPRHYPRRRSGAQFSSASATSRQLLIASCIVGIALVATTLAAIALAASGLSLVGVMPGVMPPLYQSYPHPLAQSRCPLRCTLVDTSPEGCRR